MKKLLLNLGALFFGLFIAVAILEFYLSNFYPFPTVIQSGEIYLPANSSTFIKVKDVPGLSEEIVFDRNSIGLRGPEPPRNWEDYLSIIAIGGSTTESHFQNTPETWPYLLGEELKNDLDKVWVNNAGLDGLSTFGQLVLLRSYILDLKPKVALFLISTNDVGRSEFNKYDLQTFDYKRPYFPTSAFEKSGLGRFIDNLKRSYEAKRRAQTHLFLPFTEYERIEMSPEETRAMIEGQVENLFQFHLRLQKLIELTRDNGIEPIFVTEPTILGDAIDPTSGVDLSTIQHADVNGAAYWELLKLYHQTMIKTAQAEGVLVIDLASAMPKDSLYFYDNFHYTNQGAKKVAELINQDLSPYLQEHYPEFKK